MEECLTCLNCGGQKWEVYRDKFKCCGCGNKVQLLIDLDYETKKEE